MAEEGEAGEEAGDLVMEGAEGLARIDARAAAFCD